MNLLKKIACWIKHHKIATIVAAFLIWMSFLDRNSFVMHLEREKNISAIEDSIAAYKEKIRQQREQYEKMKNDPKQLELYARERYNLKGPDEDIYIIEKK